MAAKPNKEQKASTKNTPQKNVGEEKKAGKSKPAKEEDHLDLDDEIEEKPVIKKSSKASLKSISEDDDEMDDSSDEVDIDDSEKTEDDDDNWDPDFDEFDIPKSKSGKKLTALKKPAKDEEEDFKVDDEFKDMMGSRSSGFDDEDDDY